jgi:hypothetical protein
MLLLRVTGTTTWRMSKTTNGNDGRWSARFANSSNRSPDPDWIAFPLHRNPLNRPNPQACPLHPSRSKRAPTRVQRSPMTL